MKPEKAEQVKPMHDLGKVMDWAERVLDREKPWRERRDAADEIGKLARRMRREGELPSLIEVLRKLPSFALELLNMATDLELAEPLRRATAWALSQINEWPDHFKQKILDENELEPGTTIDGSIVFL